MAGSNRNGFWRRMLRPLRPREPGTMPAGLILVVMVGALLVAMFLNADATLRKSNAKGDGIRNDIARTVAAVSDTFGLTALRGSVDSALGKNTLSDIDVDELLRRQEELAAQEAADAAAEAARKVPELPAATPASPLRLYIGGDSVVQTFGTSMQRIARGTGVFTPTLDFRIGTGLVRPDYFNWPEHLVRDVLPTNPQVLVLMFGANDSQNMNVPGGRVLTRGSEEWLTEYRRRVASTMDLLKSPTNDRLTMWVGALPMGPGSKTPGMDRLNYIYWTEAQTRPWIQYFDSWPFFSDDDLAFAANRPNADGVVRGLRQKDNLHVSTVGGDRLSWAIMDRIGRLVNISAGNVTPPPSQAPPASLVERSEIPPEMPGSL